ncbi:FxLYD domain-containing protein [Terrisporobacter sp.]|uniref:FxLYD domain-containing protein n=1 Tax=Terrisporobacter sp. TaxID=1965305 RepID=UPI002635EDCA|nr:FxLYD domain-containing protein [Terrisporobacter sp.]
MKKILIGIIIGFVVIIGGCAALFGAGVSSVDNAIKEVEQQTVKEDTKVQEMAKNIKWEVKKDAYSTKIVGVFENTSDEKIDYVEFEYKLIDSDGTVIESSFTNETEVSPGEKRKVEILCIENDFEKFEVNAKSSAL